MTDCEPLKNKSTLVEDIFNIIVNQMVELIEHELKRNDVDFEINYKNVMGLKEELKKNKEIKSKVIFDGDGLKSAVDGLIKYHEEEIDSLIVEALSVEILSIARLEDTTAFFLREKYIESLFYKIDNHYKSINAIEHWLEDAI